LHLLASAAALTLILGSLYLGWYRWPGWYLANATQVVLVMICVDVVLGPTLTFIIANKNKSRRELSRDIGIIVAVQLCALVYGSVSLWSGRPLYYVFSQDGLSLIQAYDIDVEQANLGRQQDAELAPHWYSLPRWVFVPASIAAAAAKGDDVTAMPKFYRPWNDGLPLLKAQLKKMDELRFFLPHEKKILNQRMHAAGVPSDQNNAIAITGRRRPLLAVFDPVTLKITRTFKID
jgi:hypothetical protein